MTIFPDGKREHGVIPYLQGLAYRVTMRVMHRHNWCYMQPNDLVDPLQTLYWCKWCGLRDGRVNKPASPSNEWISKMMNDEAFQKADECEHGQGHFDYCEPCGRTNGVL